MNRALRVFIYVWLSLAVLLNVLAILGTFMVAPDFWAGFSRVQEIYSPFNAYNMIAEVVLVSPAIGAHHWLNRRLTRQGPKS